MTVSCPALEIGEENRLHKMSIFKINMVNWSKLQDEKENSEWFPERSEFYNMDR